MEMRISIVASLSGTVVAGVPIGTPGYMNWFCLNKADKIINTMRRVEMIVKEPSFESSCQLQTTFYLARISFQQQLGYWLRCTPPDQTRAAARKLDTGIVRFIFEIMGLNEYIPAITETRSTISERLLLPVRLGGDGLYQLGKQEYQHTSVP
jgi:hypothetical protein